MKKSKAIADVILFLALAVGFFVLDHRFVPAGLYQGFLSILGAFAAILVIIRMRGQRFRDLGLRRPKRLWTLPIWVVGIFIATMAIGLGAQMLAAQFIDAPVDLSKFAILYKNIPILIVSLVSVWITAAFCEEVVYRGFLLGRLLEISGSGVFSVVLMSLLHAALFGALHLYQGLLGVISVGVVGFVFGIFFALQGRNLWALIIVHGLIDTLGVVQFFLVGVPTQ